VKPSEQRAKAIERYSQLAEKSKDSNAKNLNETLAHATTSKNAASGVLGAIDPKNSGLSVAGM